MQTETILKSISIQDVECAVQDSSIDIDAKRKILRQWLFAQGELPDESGSISDALKLVSQNGSKAKQTSIVLMRLLSIEDLLPAPNAQNNLERLVVDICEAGVPDLCKFLKIPPKEQTFRKFAIIQHGHSDICRLLDPLVGNYGDLEALIGGKKDILGVLNHSFIREYCGPFGLQELKAGIEVVLSKVSLMVKLQPSFLQDYESSKRALVNAIATVDEHKTYLATDYFGPLLEKASILMDEFLLTVRRQYSSKIERSWGTDEYLVKGYPLHELGRSFSLSIPLRNKGNGFAEDVRVIIIVDTNGLDISNSSTMMGTISPGPFSVIFDTQVLQPIDGFSGVVEITWGEIGNPERQKVEFDFKVRAQSAEVDWLSLEFVSPYGADVAEGDKFIGRTDLVRNLAGKILRSPMEPFYITGQKRVGKTSLALAAIDFAVENDPKSSICEHYILWGDVAHADPFKSLKLLGESIEAFIRLHLPSTVAVEQSDFDGSLAPLGGLSSLAFQYCPEKRFVITIDEFDEFPQEMYLRGSLAETFFANLRSISRKKNICLVFVGGENMPYVMDRQGQKLNNFARFNLSYFSREQEWSDFQKLIRVPSEGTLIWHDDAISAIHNASNGNPYFAKLICASVFEIAVKERDTDITASEVAVAIDIVVSRLGANSFAHLWQDGIPKPLDEREPDIMRRSRALIAATSTLKHNQEFTRENVNANKGTMVLSEIELSAVLKDFSQRNVILQAGEKFSFVLPIFEKWLVECGAQQIISDTLSEELAEALITAELASAISSKDVVELTKGWTTYRGQLIGPESVQAWLQQVDSPLDRAILFQLLKRVKFVNESHIREMLREAYSMLRRELPVPITRSKNERRRDILVTYVDGEGKSGAYYANLFADENRISSDCIISKTSFSENFKDWSNDSISAVVIIDDLAATGDSLSGNVSQFLKSHVGLLSKTKIRVISLLATEKATKKIRREFDKLAEFDLDFRTCETLLPENQALPDDHTGFKTADDWSKAKALLEDLGSKIDKRRPLGFGNLGLLVVFPHNTPNNTLPILRSYSKSSHRSEKWEPLFERVTHM